MLWNYWEFLIPSRVLSHSQRFQVFNSFLLCMTWNYWSLKTFHGHFMAHEFRNWNIYEFNGPWNIFNDPWNATIWWQKFSWPWQMFFMSCVKDSSIIHGKFMALNHGNEINNCKINDHGKRFRGFSWTFQGIFINSRC